MSIFDNNVNVTAIVDLVNLEMGFATLKFLTPDEIKDNPLVVNLKQYPDFEQGDQISGIWYAETGKFLFSK